MESMTAIALLIGCTGFGFGFLVLAIAVQDYLRARHDYLRAAQEAAKNTSWFGVPRGITGAGRALESDVVPVAKYKAALGALDALSRAAEENAMKDTLPPETEIIGATLQVSPTGQVWADIPSSENNG